MISLIICVENICNLIHYLYSKHIIDIYLCMHVDSRQLKRRMIPIQQLLCTIWYICTYVELCGSNFLNVKTREGSNTEKHLKQAIKKQLNCIVFELTFPCRYLYVCIKSNIFMFAKKRKIELTFEFRNILWYMCR